MDELSSLYLTFVATSAALILIPGPNVAVIVANSMTHGTRYGLLTVAGTSSAMVVQLALTVAGLSGLLALAAHWFEVMRWAGVGYLVYLGIGAWRAPSASLVRTAPDQTPPVRMFVRGFLISLTNPKTLLFYAAFLPQFVPAEGNRTSQLALLAATFLLIAVCLDCGWALIAARAKGALELQSRLLNRVTGGILLSAAAGLALARKPL